MNNFEKCSILKDNEITYIDNKYEIMLLSESCLQKIWDNKTEDEAWKYLNE